MFLGVLFAQQLRTVLFQQMGVTDYSVLHAEKCSGEKNVQLLNAVKSIFSSKRNCQTIVRSGCTLDIPTCSV